MTPAILVAAILVVAVGIALDLFASDSAHPPPTSPDLRAHVQPDGSLVCEPLSRRGQSCLADAEREGLAFRCGPEPRWVPRTASLSFLHWVWRNKGLRVSLVREAAERS